MNLFSKRFRRQGRGALVASRTRRNKASAFLFVNLFFAPLLCKEKAAMEFMQINSLFATKICQSLFSFGIVGAKEKSYQKRKAPQMGGAALHPASFWKSLTKTFSYGVT